MTVWTMTRKRNSPTSAVDFSHIHMDLLAGRSIDSIRSLPLGDGAIDDHFEVSLDDRDSNTKRIVLRGDFTDFHHIGAHLSAGEIWVDGNAGDHLGAAADGKRVGMLGGRITVTGNAGDHLGHRMRRGEIWVAGDVGRFAAASMIAGTIVVAGRLSTDAAIGMRRGSLLVNEMPTLADGRFTAALEREYLIASLIDSPQASPNNAAPQADFGSMWDRFRHKRVLVRRGDRAVQGQGEIVSPL
ncbi:Formyltransferase/hydrolase complex Fhc subunit C [Rubripirellula tenax]|uniref:Formyltransferase/hydrolase complex Fhc subunit C n=1 Tax=Rubripirellula tenax TaxID=2528015 RepID=A0A5C6FIJ6_9BACT|nr:hypothetical protein [Rubripirellula tenax]TWU60413.1 Formyltransferase/hydrolase complex Fhc subunit C [Rubripirellula tenax]